MSGSHSVAAPSMVFPCWNLLIEPSSTYALIKNTMSHGEYLRTISGCQPKKCYFSIGPRQEQESQIFYWILALCVYINVGAKPLFNRDMIFEI